MNKSDSHYIHVPVTPTRLITPDSPPENFGGFATGFSASFAASSLGGVTSGFSASFATSFSASGALKYFDFI